MGGIYLKIKLPPPLTGEGWGWGDEYQREMQQKIFPLPRGEGEWGL